MIEKNAYVYKPSFVKEDVYLVYAYEEISDDLMLADCELDPYQAIDAAMAKGGEK
jgi:hypothetical protein